MQYKFFVDGEWRHDEHQPFATSEYGIVNTIFLTAETNYTPEVANMEVDEQARRMVRARI